MGHFYFTRHGQTVWNVENKICGATDIELTELGHEQAMELGRKIKEEGVIGHDGAIAACEKEDLTVL